MILKKAKNHAPTWLYQNQNLKLTQQLILCYDTLCYWSNLIKKLVYHNLKLKK